MKDPTRVLFPFRLSLDLAPPAPPGAAALPPDPAAYRLVAAVEHAPGRRAPRRAERDQFVCYAWRPCPRAAATPPAAAPPAAVTAAAGGAEVPADGPARPALAPQRSLSRTERVPSAPAPARSREDPWAAAAVAANARARGGERACLQASTKSFDLPPKRALPSSALHIPRRGNAGAELTRPRSYDVPAFCSPPRHARGAASFDLERSAFCRSLNGEAGMRAWDGATLHPRAASAAWHHAQPAPPPPASESAEEASDWEELADRVGDEAAGEGGAALREAATVLVTTPVLQPLAVADSIFDFDGASLLQRDPSPSPAASSTLAPDTPAAPSQPRESSYTSFSASLPSASAVSPPQCEAAGEVAAGGALSDGLGAALPVDDADDAGVWHVIGDDGVSVVGWELVGKCEAYLLLYERVAAGSGSAAE